MQETRFGLQVGCGIFGIHMTVSLSLYYTYRLIAQSFLFYRWQYLHVIPSVYFILPSLCEKQSWISTWITESRICAPDLLRIGLVIGAHFHPSATSEPPETWEPFIQKICGFFLLRNEVILTFLRGTGQIHSGVECTAATGGNAYPWRAQAPPLTSFDLENSAFVTRAGRLTILPSIC